MSKLKLLLALASAALPLTANALGLGEIKLNSALNDRFNADIPVVGATSDELDSLDVKLANMAQFTHAGLDRPDVLNQLQFVVVRNADGSSYIHITSNAAMREPFLDFLLDAEWNNGELIREYTVLLNPPAFQTTNTAPAPAAAAPAQVPAAASTAPVATAPVPVPTPSAATQAAPETTAPMAQPPAEVAAAPQPAPSEASTPAPAASPPAAPAPSVEQAPAQRALGTNYGPIRRGETLSSIAKSVRPEGVTLNQMMVAIYQANPEVFMHNINRMKSGYILRMPTASDAQGISVTDANNEVRAQMQAWHSGSVAAAPESAPAAATSATTPSLQLVAPGSAAESNAQVPGAATAGSGEAAAVPALPAAPVTEPGKGGKGAAAPVQPESANNAPLSVQSNAGAEVQQQAAQQNAVPALPPPAATNVPLAKAPAAAKPKPVQPAQESGGGIMDMIFGIYGIIALIVIAMIVLAVVVIKKRKAGGSSGATSSARIKADWMKQESVDSGDNTAASSTTRTKGKFKKSISEEPQEKTVLSNAPTELAGGGDSDKTMLMAAPPPAPMQETVVSTGGSQLDVSDPMAEADFHMAYGLYDQAADVLKKALRQSPDSRPVQMKLLEVFFTAGDKANFVNEAKKLRQSMGSAPDKDWESVAIMGRQVAPEESLFSSTGGGAAAVDIALDGGGTDTVVSDLDALEGAFASAGASPGGEAPAPAPAPVEDNSLEFSLPDIEPAAAAPADEPMAAVPAASPGADFDLGDLNFEPTPSVKPAAAKKAEPTLGTDEPTVATDFGTDSQVEFDKALNDLASFVNTNVPAQPETPADEGHDKTLAIRPPKAAAPADDELGTIDAGPAGGGDGGGSSMNEIGTKLDLARAYIDMGDPDGAKSILEEVIAEGNPQQKSEAQELIKHVS